MKRSPFSLSHYRLTSMDLGELIPIGLVEVLPGDTFMHSTSALVRASPLLAPVMHPVEVRIHHWFVPHRLVWVDFEDFITGGPDGNNASVFPTILSPGGGWTTGSLLDYLGLPTGVAALTASAIPLRGYKMIFNEWYRDQDLQTERVVSTASGSDTTTSTVLEYCSWEKDYFTSSRPWEQKGPTITLPLGTSAPVGFLKSGTVGQAVANSTEPTALNDTTHVLAGGEPLQANLSSASAITMRALREAAALQRFEEARARYGSRYTEYLQALGVRSSDGRLQRPEYLGGGRQTIQFSEVLQTAEGSNPVGELRGHGISALRSNTYRRFFEEHGYVHTLMSIRPKTIYTQGMARTWNRRTKYDFWQRELQTIGQQAVLNKEVYAASGTPDGTFGYQDRYDEYRRSESLITGEFRTSALNHWHFGRSFASAPSLNGSFVGCIPTENPFAVPSEDVIYVMANHRLRARRLVAKTGASKLF